MSIAKHSAITAKVRAMYGKRLTNEDFEHIASMKTVADTADYLRSCPGWRNTVSSLPPGVHRGELEDVLHEQLQFEYVKIFRYSSVHDKNLLRFLICKIDYEQILFAMRRLVSINTPTYKIVVPELYLKYTTINFDALKACTNYQGLLTSIRNSIYHEPLRSLIPSPDTGIPDFTAANVTLQSTYYRTLLQFIHSNYKGSTRELLQKSVGEEIDFLNICHIMRLKQYFSNSTKNPLDLLYPFYYKLGPDFFQSLIDAPDLTAAYNLLKNSYYSKHFTEHENYEFIEQYYSLWVYYFNKKQLLMGPPSVYIPLAYLFLKELEIKRLIRTVESVRYGIPASKTPVAI